MKKISVCIACIFMSMQFVFAQTNGDYRSQQTVSKNWHDAENWLVFQNNVWITASTPPFTDSTPQLITIAKNDSIVMDTNNYTINKLIVEDSAYLALPYGDFICNDTIIIYGTLYNKHLLGTKEFSKSFIINGGTMYHSSGETFDIADNLLVTNNGTITGTATAKINAHNILLKGSHFPRIEETNNAIQYSCDSLIILEDTLENRIEIGEFDTTQIDVYGQVDFNGKVGVKHFSNFTIHESGFFSSSDNDAFNIYGNIVIHGDFESGKGTYYLQGTDKAIEGNAEFYKIDLTGTYTNFCTEDMPLFVKLEFTGTGTIFQHEYGYIQTRCDILPQIIPTPHSVIEYTGGQGATIYLKGELSNLILNNHKCTYVLENDISIKSIFHVPEDSILIDLNGHTLTFDNWSELDISFPFSSKHRISLSNGSIIAKNVLPNDTVFFPISHNQDTTSLARIEITNNDTKACNFAVDSLSLYASKNAQPNGNRYISGLVNSTYHIASSCENATIKLFWHADNELPIFERNACNIYHYNGSEWEPLHEISVATNETESIYSLEATTYEFSPFMIQSDNVLLNINLTNYAINQDESGNTINWTWEAAQTSELVSFSLEKSNNGIHFRTIQEFTASANNSFTYTDTENTNDYYYRLALTHSDNSISYSKILFVRNQSPMEIWKINQQIHVAASKNATIHIYSVTGRLIAISTQQTFTSSNLPTGQYIVCIMYENQIIEKEKICIE
ncbi:MAG: T9SS type A sorting domain-containing protein [Bacteroidales bacterium]|jgi:PGF-pre-PGF domain-containing protein|nr:T9SS type A sorting domain-containing protein [Bacteroidales bacterium]